MDMPYRADRYLTRKFQNLVDGCFGLELVFSSQQVETRVTRVVFWESVGQFFIEPCTHEIPLAVLECLIEEAKALLQD